ncbi:Ovate protein family, C-terminal [Parasponia andersonii]|uniref:Transcription repressor n=1 Tax=Parasponia andersonii TaxID=3476 RepID=A0A2P5D9V6_PARAD|nr:Ovate protein family, C-terminal [Parasponia andersonii]
MKLPFLSNQTTEPNSTIWPWPSCTQTRTLSFRATGSNDNIFKTLNSAFLDSSSTTHEPHLAESFFTNSSESASFSTTSDDPPSAGAGSGDPVEAVIQGLRSRECRLFFEPGETSTASILEEANTKEQEEEVVVLDNSNIIKKVIPYKESVALSMESRNPYLDFKKSMEEMVEAHGLKGWESLEELLSWYLKMNGKDNHEYIVGAFVDLLVGLAFRNFNINKSSPSSSSTCTNFTCSNNCDSPYSPLSFCNTSSSSCCSSSVSSTPCVSSIEVGELEIENTPCLASLIEIEEEKNVEEEEEEEDHGHGHDDVSS